jgi:hypothetical protein
MLVPGLLVNTGPKDHAPMKSLHFNRFEGDHWVRNCSPHPGEDIPGPPC